MEKKRIGRPGGKGKAIAQDRSLCPARSWDCWQGETTQAYEAFPIYLTLGIDRSIAKVASRVQKGESLVCRWSVMWHWLDRISEYDSHMLNVQVKAREKVVAETAALWERRKRDRAERAYRIGEKMVARAEEMIAMPLTRKRLDRDGKTIVVEPSKWTLATACGMVKDGLMLQKLAQDDSLEPDDFDPMTATPEECREYVRARAQRQADVRAILDSE